jgi:hypothetical protein
MSKVIVRYAAQKKTYHIDDAVVETGWLPGQAFKLANDGQTAELAVGDETMFIAIDDDDELSSPPTGSLGTFVFGSGTEIVIDHSEEVLASSVARAYASGVESANASTDLYINSDSKWDTIATGSVKGKLSEIPSANNNYRVGVILRF